MLVVFFFSSNEIRNCFNRKHCKAVFPTKNHSASPLKQLFALEECSFFMRSHLVTADVEDRF